MSLGTNSITLRQTFGQEGGGDLLQGKESEMSEFVTCLAQHP